MQYGHSTQTYNVGDDTRVLTDHSARLSLIDDRYNIVAIDFTTLTPNAALPTIDAIIERLHTIRTELLTKAVVAQP